MNRIVPRVDDAPPDRWTGPVLALLFVLVLAAAATAAPAMAQMPGLGSTAGDGKQTAPAPMPMEQVVDAARKSGATVVVISPEASATAAAGSGMMSPGEAMETAATVRNALAAMVASVPHVPADIEAALRRVTSAGTLGWLGPSFLLAAAAILAGLVVRWLLIAWGRSYFRDIYDPAPRDRAEKIGYLMMRTALMWTGVLAFLLGGAALIVILSPQHGPARITGLTFLSTAALFLAVRVLFYNVFVPHTPQYRLVPFDDAAAQRLYRQLIILLAVSAVVFGVSLWMSQFTLPAEVHDLLLVVSSILTSLLLIVYALVHRRAIAAAIRGHAPRPARWRVVLAAIWHVLAVVYLVVATALNVVAIVMRTGLTIGPVLGPILAFVAGFGAYGLLVLLIDRRFRRKEAALYVHQPAAVPEPPEDATAPGAAPIDSLAVAPEHATADLPPDLSGEAAPAATVAPAGPINPVTAWRLRWKHLAEKASALLALAFALGVLLWVWGWLAPGAEATRLLGIGIVLFAAYIAYQAVKTWIDGKLAEEEPAHGTGETEEGMGAGSSRLATLLPLVRNALVIAILVIVGMVLLAGLGVDIAPLFAGAGVIGLAIGFGAQTLIRDIFSGAFFLLDDAFRKGEYIDVGGVMGTVEKISVRSFQLRHQNGPLHTIPFGEIKQLTNYSRDWVVMKLPLRLTYDTDVEKVRKLVKKLGQEMQNDPEIGRMFVQPLKSQGVVQMDDSAMIVRVKFMTRPGDQFILRRHVYTRVHDLFEKEGIHFATRQVTVRIADEQEGPLSEEERERRRRAALGAVQPVIESAAAESG